MDIQKQLDLLQRESSNIREFTLILQLVFVLILGFLTCSAVSECERDNGWITFHPSSFIFISNINIVIKVFTLAIIDGHEIC